MVARMAACLAGRYEVEIIHGGRGYTLEELGSTFDLDLDGVGERVVEEAMAGFSVPGSRSTFSRVVTGFGRERTLTQPYDLFIYSGHRTPPMCRPGRGLIYCHFPFDARPSVRFEEDACLAERSAASRWLRLQLYERIWDRRMAGFPVLLANSWFSAEWIDRLWGRRAEVVHPPVDADMASSASVTGKRDSIVSVGRFIATDRKNLRAQLRALPEFLRQAGGDWTLHMIGFCGDLKQDRQFLDELREEAAGLPVRFAVNAQRDEVSRVFQEARLFWHTTGLAATEGYTAPRFQEHFGIATVEAMRAGCVPIVPAAGGQPEIVSHTENGFLCADVDDLIEFSVAVARDERLAERLACAAIRRSNEFTPDVFEERIRHFVARALDSGGPEPDVEKRSVT